MDSVSSPVKFVFRIEDDIGSPGIRLIYYICMGSSSTEVSILELNLESITGRVRQTIGPGKVPYTVRELLESIITFP